MFLTWLAVVKHSFILCAEGGEKLKLAMSEAEQSVLMLAEEAELGPRPPPQPAVDPELPLGELK